MPEGPETCGARLPVSRVLGTDGDLEQAREEVDARSARALGEAVTVHDEVAVAARTRERGGVGFALCGESRGVVERRDGVLDEPAVRMFGMKKFGGALG